MAISSVSYNSGYETEAVDKKGLAPASSTLNMDDFMLLLSVQMQNQDMNNPMSNAEMMGQLTQMATVQAMNTFTELSSTQYALNLIGKDVTVAATDAGTTGIKTKTGKVTGLDMASMKVFLDGDKTPYGLGNVMEVGTVPKEEEGKDPEKKPDPAAQTGRNSNTPMTPGSTVQNTPMTPGSTAQNTPIAPGSEAAVQQTGDYSRAVLGTPVKGRRPTAEPGDISSTQQLPIAPGSDDDSDAVGRASGSYGRIVSAEERMYQATPIGPGYRNGQPI
ncbi:MAG: flagellar hook capping FlgD N-terminal domain-containing protein [Hungatella sp.]